MLNYHASKNRNVGFPEERQINSRCQWRDLLDSYIFYTTFGDQLFASEINDPERSPLSNIYRVRFLALNLNLIHSLIIPLFHPGEIQFFVVVIFVYNFSWFAKLKKKFICCTSLNSEPIIITRPPLISQP